MNSKFPKKRILYLGTDPSHFASTDEVIHYPVIQIVPRPRSDPAILQAQKQLNSFSHILFTSKHGVQTFFSLWPMPKQAQAIVIGQVTAQHLARKGVSTSLIAQEENQEGLIKLLSSLIIPHLFLPRSSRSRPKIAEYLTQQNIPFCACDLYDTVTRHPTTLPRWNEIDAILFTSPSTVEAFIELFGTLPQNKELLAIGPITQAVLNSLVTESIRRL